MVTADDVRRIAMGLAGTVEAPHFARQAFRADRIYATLAADGLSANVPLDPHEQEVMCEMRPDAFVPVSTSGNGWTTLILDALDLATLETVLTGAWQRHGIKAKPRRR